MHEEQQLQIQGEPQVTHQRPQPKALGPAHEYYRARFIRVDEERPFDLEWRTDIIYTAPKAYPSTTKLTYRLQVVTNDSRIIELAIVHSRRVAKRRLQKIEDDLLELSKMRFDEKYRIKAIAPEPKPDPDPLTSLVPPLGTGHEHVMVFAGINRSPG